MKPKATFGSKPPGFSYQCCLLLILGTVCVCFWKTSSWNGTQTGSSTSIHLDVSLGILNQSRKGGHLQKKPHHSVSRYMLKLYQRRPDADIVRAIEPTHISHPLKDANRVIEFPLPELDSEEVLQVAELVSTAGTILRVKSLGDPPQEQVQRSRKDDSWRAFDVTSLVKTRSSDNVLKLLIRGRVSATIHREVPILLLSYSKSRHRKRRIRSADDEVLEEEDSGIGTGSGSPGSGRKKRRNSCRRRPLYVDFSVISYDEWVVAPPGYEAYQCSGKCFYPFADHLSPTKHAIVQTLVHGALQGTVGGSKPGRACCVPTRLAPTSLLYLDSTGTLTYQFGYEDMVVAECGCR